MCILSTHLFSSSVGNWLLGAPAKNDKKVDFSCTHRCGEWGDKSIREIEWQFVQCLYDADLITSFIERNFQARCRFKRKEFAKHPPVEVDFYERPSNFESVWYQKMLECNDEGLLTNDAYLSISNAYSCYGDWAFFWKIRLIRIIISCA